MPRLEEYLEDADRLAQKVVDAWAVNRQAGKPTSAQFMNVFDKACRHIEARRHADDRRKFNDLSEQDAAEEKAARQAFAEARRALDEEHDAAQR